ncbi:MAG: hypothetical protein ACR2RV_17710 [Verrucomicrobiales bacterium]
MDLETIQKLSGMTLELAPGREGLALFYVGHRPAAKGYGEVSLYRLERG